jgi:diacylglycerol kinase family enzyme
MVVGAHVRRSDVVCREAAEIELDPMHTSDRVPYQIDGDQVGSLPVRITVEDRVLKLRVPDAA